MQRVTKSQKVHISSHDGLQILHTTNFKKNFEIGSRAFSRESVEYQEFVCHKNLAKLFKKFERNSELAICWLENNYMNLNTEKSDHNQEKQWAQISKHSFLQGWNTPFSEGTHPPSFWVTPSFWSKFKKLPPSFWQPPKLVHVSCKKHFKRCYVSYYTKSTENIINISLFTFRLNSVFTTDTSFG